MSGRLAAGLRVGIVGLIVAWAAASIAFAARTTPSAITPPIRTEDHARDEPSRDLARFDRGARIRVSSWDMHRRHHPLFAIDGEPMPTPREVWSPAPGDDSPWAEVMLATPSRVRRVVLSFAAPGGGEASARAPAHAVKCMSGGDRLDERRVAASAATSVTHSLGDACLSADVLRIELDAFSAPFSLYEIEVRGP